MITVFRNVSVYDADSVTGYAGPVDVLVDGELISAVGSGLHIPPDAVVVDGRHQLLLPGLVNAHFHSPANHLKGSVRSLPLELFMLFESPADPALTPSPREAYLRTLIGAIEMLHNGVTSVQDDAFLMPFPDPLIIDAVAAAYRDCGIRATLALDQPELSEAEKLPFVSVLRAGLGARADLLDQPAPMPSAQLLEAYQHLIGSWHRAAGDRIRAAVSISAPQRVSPDYFAALDDLAERHGLPLYAHCLETKPQRTLMTQQARFEGRSLVAYVAGLGLLKPHTNVIHAVWVDEDDLDLIAASGAVVVHNPISNLRLGSGVMAWRPVRERGIPIALGTDEAICDDAVNLWPVIKTVGLVHNVEDPDPDRWPRPAEILDSLWLGGAQAQRRHGELGAIRPGQLADLCLLDLTSTAFTPFNDLREQLVHCEDGRHVSLTMVAGQVVCRDGKLIMVDQDAVLAEARELFAAKRGSLAAARRDAEDLTAGYRAMIAAAAATDVGFSRWVG